MSTRQKIIVMFLMGLFTAANAQMHGGGQHNPDSLAKITITGKAIVTNDQNHPLYFLDSDNDGEANYRLNFGPWWYKPDSSNAVRPNDGDDITITGGIDDRHSSNPEIVVYEINGEFWRDPFYAFWNNFGNHNHGGGHHTNGCNGYAFGWQHDSLEFVELSGVALVDTTFFMKHYYLDTDNDTIPNYFLNFGPWWYQPESGAVRPENGQQITITGGLINRANFNSIVVYTINGFVWRDSTFFQGHLGGGWISGNMTNPSTFHNPYDEHDQFTVHPGWHQSGHHGAMMSDSLFCQILELYPSEVPNSSGENHFMGFEIGLFNPSGNNNMWNGGNCGGHMNFGNNADFQIHYNDIQLMGNNIDENSLKAKYWDDQSNSWINISNVSVNTDQNTISFSNSEVANFLIVTGDKVTSVETEDANLVKDFVLQQNYPNPFNPSTTIAFSIKKEAKISLTVFDVLGREITTLVDKNLQQGTYQVNFDGQNLGSGIYYYRLKAKNVETVKKMILTK